MSANVRPLVARPRIVPGLIGAPETMTLDPETLVVLVPEGAGHVREVRNGGEKVLLVFEAGKNLEADVVPLREAKGHGRVLFRNELGWHNAVV